MPTNRLGGRRLKRTQGNEQSRVKVIMIAFDGEKTESDYFEGWKSELGTKSGVVLHPFYVKSGGNAFNAVLTATKSNKLDKDYDEFWCVCDSDDTPASGLLKAKALAEKHGVKLAISSRSFEVWLALHFDIISTSEIASETQAIALVAIHHPAYTKRNKTIPFSILRSRTEAARKNAKWLLRCGCANPATDVHELMDAILGEQPEE